MFGRIIEYGPVHNKPVLTLGFNEANVVASGFDVELAGELREVLDVGEESVRVALFLELCVEAVQPIWRKNSNH